MLITRNNNKAYIYLAAYSVTQITLASIFGNWPNTLKSNRVTLSPVGSLKGSRQSLDPDLFQLWFNHFMNAAKCSFLFSCVVILFSNKAVLCCCWFEEKHYYCLKVGGNLLTVMPKQQKIGNGKGILKEKRCKDKIATCGSSFQFNKGGENFAKYIKALSQYLYRRGCFPHIDGRANWTHLQNLEICALYNKWLRRNTKVE